MFIMSKRTLAILEVLFLGPHLQGFRLALVSQSVLTELAPHAIKVPTDASHPIPSQIPQASVSCPNNIRQKTLRKGLGLGCMASVAASLDPMLNPIGKQLKPTNPNLDSTV
jgi:hypothetical protein